MVKPIGEAAIRRFSDALLAGKDYFLSVAPEELEGVTKIRFAKGHGPQDITNPVDTSFDAYYEGVIIPGIRSGKISDGVSTKFDDRKTRGDARNNFVAENILHLSVGPTEYRTYKKALDESFEDAVPLIFRGQIENNDPWMYMPNALGVAVFALTKEGHVYIGERAQNVDKPGWLCTVAGHLTFNRDVSKIDVFADAQKELVEEFGIEQKLDSGCARVIGVSSPTNLSNSDIMFVVQTEKPDSYFESGEWLRHVSEREHKSLVRIASKTEVQDMLHEGRMPDGRKLPGILYSANLGLDYLAKNHF